MSKKVEISVLTLLFIFTIYCTLTTGSFWDEPYEMNIGKNRLKYLFSFGAFEYLDHYKHTEFYPGFYNTLAIFVTKMFPIKYEIEIWRLLHVTFSILTIFGIYGISKTLFNKKVGKIVFLLCFLNPIFFGHMIMNSKDTIVVFAHVWSAYIFLKYLQNQKKSKRYILFAGLTVGLGMGVRFPFLVTLIPLFLFLIIDILFFKKIINHKFLLKKFILDLIIVLIIAYLIAVSCWPHVHGNIFLDPFKLLFTQTKIVQDIGTPWILFNGNFFATMDLPASYIIINLLYKSPEFILVCYLIFIFLILINKKKNIADFNSSFIKIFLIFLILLFPMIYFIFLPYRVYDGLRLFLHIMPYLNIIPGLVIYYLLVNLNTMTSKLLLTTLVVLFVYYIYIFVSLTPYQYTYLNKLNGNFSTSYNKFENDYFAISIKELIRKIPNNANLTNNNKKIKISFCGAPHYHSKRELDKLRNFDYEIMDLYEEDFDYVIMTNRAVADRNEDVPKNVMSCFKKIKGEDIIKVERNGLMLSTLRKKF